jgi:RNA polymerase sigma-70 factor (ECF subfamily)
VGADQSPPPAREARFLALTSSHIAALELVASRLCREPAAAADLVQDTLVRAWQRFDSLKDEERIRGWLVRILRNMWITQLRRRRKEVSIEEIHEPRAPIADEASWWESITVEDLRQAIEQLREPYRSAAVLHDLDGHSYRRISVLLGIPSATVATRIHRAHVQLRELLRIKLGVEAPSAPRRRGQRTFSEASIARTLGVCASTVFFGPTSLK